MSIRGSNHLVDSPYPSAQPTLFFAKTKQLNLRPLYVGPEILEACLKKPSASLSKVARLTAMS